jgi:C1A family cysteine protease
MPGKIKKLIIVLPVVAAGLILFTVVPSRPQSGYADRFKKDVEDQKARQKKDIETLKIKINDLRNQIKQRNLKFRVEITKAMQQPIESITGLKKPANFKETAVTKNKKAIERKEKRKKEKRKKKKAMMEYPPQAGLYFASWGGPELVLAANDEWFEDDGYFEQFWKDESAKDRTPKEDAAKDEKKKETSADAAKKDELKKPDAVDPAKMSADPALAAFNWRDAKKCSPVKDQNICGSCWAFTAAAVTESGWLIRNNSELDLSEQFIIDCAVDDMGDAGGCNGGWYGSVFDYLMTRGALLETADPYKVADGVCPANAADTAFRVSTWGYVSADGGTPTVQEMKAALCRYGPLAATVNATEAFTAYAGGVFDMKEPMISADDTNHAIVIAGWDDARNAYLVKNSWSEAWGEKGYVWIDYASNNIGYGACWLVVAAENPQN